MVQSMNESHRILCIEDNARERAARISILAGASYDVWEAASGSKGLELVANQPDLIVVDVGLPDIDAFEVCRRIKANAVTRHIPVLLLADRFTEDDDRAAGLDGGADAYLVKTTPGNMFLVTVRSLLRMHDAERSLAMAVFKADAVNDAKTPAQPTELAGANETAVIDVADLCERLGGDREAVRDILNLFLADVQTDIDLLERGARERDTEQVMRQAHSLKGTLANVGAAAAQRAAADLEVAGKRDDWSAIPSGIDDLKSAIALARHAIREAADRLTDELESAGGTKRTTEMAGRKRPAAPRQTATGPVRAIICDDSVAMRHALMRMLEGFPVEVVGQAGNPDEAFRLADKLAPELVFLDVVMPGGSGIDVLRRLREPPCAPMVVMLSSVAERATVIECRQLGAADYLLKPFDATTLKACIERVQVKLRGK